MLKSRVLSCAVLVAELLNVRANAQSSVRLSADEQPSATARFVPVAESAGPANAGSSWSSSVNASVAPAKSGAIVSGVVAAPVKKSGSGGNGRVRPFSKLAIGTQSGTLGIGGQIATPLMRRMNLRGGADFLNFGYGTAIDGANYNAQLHLKSGQVSIDLFPFKGGFHISPGVLIFKSALSASMYVPGGNAFDLGSSNYTSSASDPITGSADMVFTRTIMPSLTIGFGNMITREQKHWSMPIEIGAAYTGHYTAQLNVQGTACNTLGCMSTSSSQIQQSILQEQGDMNETMKHYQLYPILTSGLSYRF